MTLITKLVISSFISVMSLLILARPPAPTSVDLMPRPETVWQGLEQPAPLPPTTVSQTLITQPDACQTVYDMAKHVGWPSDQLGQLVAIAQRESRCQPAAFNATDPNGGSNGVMQINQFWCKPTRYYPRGYLQAFGLIRNCDNLFDLQANLRSALAIYRYSNGWRAWSQ